MNIKYLAVAGVIACALSGSAWAQSSSSGIGDAVEHDQSSAAGLNSTESKAFPRGANERVEGRSAIPATGASSPYVTSPPSE